MKINFDPFDGDYEDDDYYEDENNFRQNKKWKFRDSDRASAGDNSYKKNIRRRRKQKQKNQEYQEKIGYKDDGEEEF